MFLGEQIAQRHLHYNDRLIGVVGDAGSGKSSLIKGMFPGLELANDDDIINPRKIMQARDSFGELREASSFHLDIRFLQAFMQMYEIADFIKLLLENKQHLEPVQSLSMCAQVQQRAWSLAALPEGLLLQKAASAVLRVLAGQVARFCSVFRALRLAATAVAKQGTRCGDFEHALTSARCCGSGQRPAPQWQMGRQVAPRWWDSRGFLHAVRCAKAGAGSV